MLAAKFHILICIFLPVIAGLTLTYPVQKGLCYMDPDKTPAEDFKQIFGDALFDELSKIYLQMIFDVKPQIISFYSKLLHELPADDEHTEALQYTIERLQNEFKNTDEVPEDKETRLNLIQIYREIAYKNLELSFMETAQVSKAEFTYLQYKHRTTDDGYNAEYRKFVKDSYAVWKPMYDCIPTQYFKKYPEFNEIQAYYEEFLKMDDKNLKYHKGMTIVSTMAQFFDNELKYLQEVLVNIEYLWSLCKYTSSNTTATQFKRMFGYKFYDALTKKHSEMIFISFPKFNAFYKPLILELSAANNDNEAEIIANSNMRKNAAKQLMHVGLPEDINARVKLIKIFNELHDVITNLALDFDCDIENNEKDTTYQKYMAAFKEWQVQYFKSMHKIWKKMYKCVPAEYLNSDEDYTIVDEYLQVYLNTVNSDDDTDKITLMLKRIEQDFLTKFSWGKESLELI